MRALKYVLAIILILVLCLAALSPWENGYILRKQYLKFISIVNKQQNIFQVDIQHYHLGWFRSDIKLHLSIKDTQAHTIGFTIKQHVWHGPYVYVPKEGFRHLFIMGKTNAIMDDASALLAKLQKPLVFHLLTKIDLDNDTWTQYEIDPLMFSLPEGKISIQKIDGIIKFKLRHPIQYTLHTKDISLLMSGIQINLPELSYDHSQQCVNRDCTITKKLIIPNIALQENQINYGLQGINLDYTAFIDAQNLHNYKLNFICGKIINNQTQFGPFTMHLGINNVNGLALTKINQPHADNVNPQQQLNFAPIVLLRVLANLPQLVTEKFIVLDNAQLTMPGGNITFDGKLYWPTNLPLPQNLDAVAEQLQLEAKLHIDSGVINQNSLKFVKQWENMVKQGYLTQNSTGYSMLLTNDKGTIKTNGKILDFTQPMRLLYTDLLLN